MLRIHFSKKFVVPIILAGILGLLAIIYFFYPPAEPVPPELSSPVYSGDETALFAVIGDYGRSGKAEEDVSILVKSWNPDFIITTGDNNYSNIDQVTMDRNIGHYYSEYIVNGDSMGSNGTKQNRFFPDLGNHDWDSIICLFGTCRGVYLGYFTLPGNELYYDFIWGPVHFFMVDSDPREPDGNSADSVQGLWLKEGLSASTSPWNVVVTHFPPYSSGHNHGSTDFTEWPYAEWGADIVMSGHDHIYERVVVEGLPYIVNGLGGKGLHQFDAAVPGSEVRYNQDYGAMLVEADQQTMTIKFISRTGELIDDFSISNEIIER
jgi:hypothetical protein